MPNNYRTQAPNWKPDAVPSPQGWRHPETNELLVSIKLDMSVFEQEVVAEEKPKSKKAKKEEVVVEESPVAVETVIDPVAEVVSDVVAEVTEE